MEYAFGCMMIMNAKHLDSYFSSFCPQYEFVSAYFLKIPAFKELGVQCTCPEFVMVCSLY